MPAESAPEDRKSAVVGRPRSQDATQAVRQAALALAYEGGVHHATVDRIAQRSGVAKTTIYRRWPHAAAVVMDAFLDEVAPLIPYRRGDSVQATFASAVKRLASALRGPRGELLRHLLGAAQSDAQLQQAFWDNWIAPRRQQARTMIAAAVADGELRSDIDVDVLIDELFGAVYYRLMIPYGELTNGYVERLVEQVFDGVRARQDAPRR